MLCDPSCGSRFCRGPEPDDLPEAANGYLIIPKRRKHRKIKCGAWFGRLEDAGLIVSVHHAQPCECPQREFPHFYVLYGTVSRCSVKNVDNRRLQYKHQKVRPV